MLHDQLLISLIKLVFQFFIPILRIGVNGLTATILSIHHISHELLHDELVKAFLLVGLLWGSPRILDYLLIDS